MLITPLAICLIFSSPLNTSERSGIYLHRDKTSKQPVLYQYMLSLERLLILTATFIIQFSIRCFAITSSVKWEKYTVMINYTVNSVDIKICLSVAILLINCVCLNRFEKPSQSCTSKPHMKKTRWLVHVKPYFSPKKSVSIEKVFLIQKLHHAA